MQKFDTSEFRHRFIDISESGLIDRSESCSEFIDTSEFFFFFCFDTSDRNSISLIFSIIIFGIEYCDG